MIQSSEINNVIKLVTDALNGVGVWYYIGGSVASSAYGTARSTLDVDMISCLDLSKVSEFREKLKNEFYVSDEHIREAVSRRSCFNLIHLKSSIKIDIFISKQRSYDVRASERRRLDTLDEEPGSPEFYLASAEDVILAKLEWYKNGQCVSQKQWLDILGVLRVQRDHLDLDYLKNWANEIGVDQLFAKAIEEVFGR